MGRPEKSFDWKVLDAVLQYNASKKDCAGFLEVSEDTIERRIKSEYNMTFSEYKNLKMGKARIKLAQKQYDMAMKGNVPLLIWLGKNWLGQSDKQETLTTGEVKIEISKEDTKL